MLKNMIDNLDNVIEEIKEKVRKNPKYLHPTNKDRLEDQKRLKFPNGYSYICWLIKIGAIKTKNKVDIDFYTQLEVKYGKDFVNWAKQHADVPAYYLNAGCKTRKEYGDKRAQIAGFKSEADRYREHNREYSWITGRTNPLEFDEELHFGDITEEFFKEFLLNCFESVRRTGYNDDGIDYFCNNPQEEFIGKYPQFRLERNKKYNIQHMARCLRYRQNRTPNWNYYVNYNDKVDYFILSAWDDKDDLNILHVWIFHKDDIIGDKKFWKRENFTITNLVTKLKEFDKYELEKKDLEQLKNLVKK